MSLKENKLSGLLSVALGILFLALKQNVITAAMCVLGIVFIISAITDLSKKSYPFAIVKGVIGLSLIIFGWALVSVALYIMSALIVIFGLMQIVGIKARAEDKSKTEKALIYAKPVLYLLAGICLLFNQGGSVAAAFIITGVLLILSGSLLVLEKR